MKNRLKKLTDRLRAKDAEYDSVMDAICENNRKLTVILCSISGAIFAILIALGLLNIGVKPELVQVYSVALVLALVILLIVRLTSHKSHNASMLATYLTMGAIVFYSIFVSYCAPDHYTVTFIAMMCIMSMAFVDKLVRIGAAHIVVTAICAVMIWLTKEDSVRVTDLINVVSFSAMSFVGGFFTVEMKVHNYVLDKMQGEDIAKGRQRISDMEFEALKLLTAVKSNYDMVVSVNLTRNTYELIGTESFVTRGDAIVGIFDDVIDTHAGKVVDADRELYYNTFSRQALLRAHEEGKKEVYLEYRQRDENGVPHWLGTHTMFVDNPNSTDITEITISQNIDERVRKEEEIKAALLKEQELKKQYAAADERRDFLETLAVNLPGGYHRCTTDHRFRLTFASNSFTQVTGYTMQQLEDELGGSYFELVAPVDKDYFMSLAPQLERDGFIYCAYRIRRRDGKIRWVQDSTQYVERDGEQYYQCALSDITEQIEELEQAKRLAEASSQAKSTFLFNISHDIRTPMNAIKGFTGMIKDHRDDPKLVGDAVEKIEKASDTLMTLMNDVLDLSRIERGKEVLNLEPVELHDHGSGLIEMFSSEMEEAGIELAVEADITHTHVMCDPVKLSRIGMNMLSNAKKFTPSGGRVTFGITELSCDGETATYRLFTRDTGVGMSEDFLSRAFEQFERERTATESRVSGSGLGLAIIKNFVNLMGGEVSLQSELGRGTEISATIPFRLVGDAEKSAVRNLGQSMDVAGKRVLLVEDNEFNREIAGYVLNKLQLTVETAQNGAECIDRLLSVEAGYYDLILMDIQMPVMNGYTAAQEIRRLPDKAKAGIPILAMTANAFEEDKRKCLEVGMNGHIGKPIDPDALIQELSRVLH